MRSHSFWQELAEHLRARRPGAWRDPLGGPVASPDEVFAWLLAASGRVRAHDDRILFRTYLDGRFTETSPSLHPAASDGSVAGYVRRLDAEHGESMVAVNHLQGAHPDAWRRALTLLDALHAHTGLRAGGAILDLFAGAYKKGPFGVHKDQFDVVTFVLEGRKRFLAWPYERFSGRPEVARGAALRPVSLQHLDYSSEREGAVVLEGGPGDAFVWPAEWWHVAESDHGHCTTFSLGLAREETSLRFAEEAARELVDEGALPLERELADLHGDVGDALGAQAARIARVAQEAALRRRVEERLLAFRTAYGFAAVPEAAPREALPDDLTLRLVARGALAWMVRGEQVTWSAGGAVYRYPAADAVIAALRRVATGEAFTVGAIAALADDAVAPDALRHMLATMRARHALTVPSE